MAEFDEKAVIERIIELRKDFAGVRGKSKFAKAIGISPSTYNYYENDRLPSVAILLRICEITGADINWLLTEKTSSAKGNPHLNPEPANKLNSLLETNPETESAVMAFLELLSEKKGVEKSLSDEMQPPPSTRPGWVPILGRTAAGMAYFWNQTNLPEPKEAIVELDELVERHTGRAIMARNSGNIAIDLQIGPLVGELKNLSVNLIQVSSQNSAAGPDQVVQFIECPQIHALFPDAFALQIDGDSMSPRINDNDIVILSPSVPAAQGHVGVARLAGQIGVTCKIIRTTQELLHLIPINERYETKTVPTQNLLWALAVLCHVKTQT